MNYTLTGLTLSQDPSGYFNDVLFIEHHSRLHIFKHFKIKRCHSRAQLLHFCSAHLGCNIEDINISATINLDILKYKL